jgi:hypothetical protein
LNIQKSFYLNYSAKDNCRITALSDAGRSYPSTLCNRSPNILVDMFENLYDHVVSGNSSKALELLNENECTKRKRVAIRLVRSKLKGISDGYETLTGMRIGSEEGSKLVDTSSVISVGYLLA